MTLAGRTDLPSQIRQSASAIGDCEFGIDGRHPAGFDVQGTQQRLLNENPAQRQRPEEDIQCRDPTDNS